MGIGALQALYPKDSLGPVMQWNRIRFLSPIIYRPSTRPRTRK
jgi:hypothetical protein